MAGAIRTWLSGYRTLCVLVVNTAALLVVLNLIAWGVLCITGPRQDAFNMRVQFGEALYKAYPHRSREEVNALVDEIGTMEFAPYVQVRKPAFRGRFLNVADESYRFSTTAPGQGPWPPDRANFNIFCFGGSTTFGWGVADDETWPAAMQAMLNDGESHGAPGNGGARRVCVYNFGTAWFLSTQSRICFEQLLAEGFKPDLAVFLEGMNDMLQARWAQPALTQTLQQVTERSTMKLGLDAAKQLWGVTPLVKLLGRRPNSALKSEPDREFAPGVDPDALAAERLTKNEEMIEAIGERVGARVLVAWQPSPLYRYDVSKHFLMDEPANWIVLKNGWEKARALFERRAMGRGFVWAADIQEDVPEMLYVDHIHYNPKLNRMVAEFLVMTLRERGLLDGLER